jgi:putative hemolysin
VLLATLVVACGSDDGPTGPTEPSQPSTGMPNPASVYCEEQGGTVEIVEDEDGAQRGDCVLPDGTRVDEWEYFREQTGATVPGG